MSERGKWFAAGNVATGFIAFGNVSTGFIAFGNLARGFVAIGNVAVGVIAIGNVGAGMLFGAGATVATGVVAVSPIVALGVVAAGSLLFDLPGVTGLVPLLVWLVLGMAVRGKKPEPPAHLPVPVRLADLRAGQVARGYVRARGLRREGREAVATVEGESLRVPLEVDLPGAVEGEVLLLLEVTRARPGDDAGYRQAPEEVLGLSCHGFERVPRPPFPWSDGAHVNHYLSRAWRAFAGLGLVLFVLRVAGLVP